MEVTNGNILAIHSTEDPQSDEKEDDVEEKEWVRDEGIDAQEDKDESIVA